MHGLCYIQRGSRRTGRTENLFVSQEEKFLCVSNIVLKKRISQKNEQTMHTMQPSSS